MKNLKPIEWEPKQVNVADVKPTPNNFKIKTELGKERLAMSLKKFGLAGTCVVTTDLVLIDGNSRLIEAKQKGQKKIWVSMPNRKMTAKEFTEMSAMFDFAVAGKVDTERINAELGNTKDFFEQWGIELNPSILERLGNKAPLDGLEYPGENGSKKKGTEDSTPSVDIRMVQLFFNVKQEAEFRKIEEALQKKFKTESTTLTVLKALKSIKI